MTRKEQNKILDAKIESNFNQYKVDRLNAELSAFSGGDLNKYEFLKRIDLNYKPNALDKARFEFSPLGQTFSLGLDKTAQGYQEEGVIKLLKDIIDGLAGGIAPRGPGLDDPNNDDPNNDDHDYDDYRPDYNDDNNDDDNNDHILKYQQTINQLLGEIERININNEEHINKINQNDKILDLETKLKDNKLLTEEILDKAGKVISKFEKEHHNNYIRELARSNDLYRQLGQVRDQYEQHTRDFNEEIIANNKLINTMIKNFKKCNDENKHIIEQLMSICHDKDKNIEELKRDLDDKLNKINNLNYEIENKDFFKNEIYEKLQKIEKNNEELENFISIYDDIVKEDKDKIYSKLSKFKNNMEDYINKLEKLNEYLDKFDNKMSVLNDKISKIKYAIKNKTLTSDEENELQNKIKKLESEKNSINNELTHAVHIIKKIP